MANPTIGATTPRIQYTATASQTLFTVPFEFIADADLTVYVNGTLKTLTTDYTVSGANTSGGGSITFVTGRTAGEVVTILGDQDYSRNTNKYTKYGLLPAEVLEADFDSLTVQTKQLARDGQFALRAPLTDTGSPSMTLPAVATRASKALGFDASGNPTVSASTLSAIDSTVQIIDTLNALPAGASSSVSYQPAGTGAVTTTVQAKLRETVSVKDFGAVGDGVADDAAAIRAAIVALPAGGTLHFPLGTYLVSQDGANVWCIQFTKSVVVTADPGTEIKGSTNGARTVIRCSAKVISSSHLVVNGNNKTNIAVEIDSSANDTSLSFWEAKNVTQQYSTTYQAACFRIAAAIGVTLDSCYAHDATSYPNAVIGDNAGAARGILLDGTASTWGINTIRNCRVDNILNTNGIAGDYEDEDGIVTQLNNTFTVVEQNYVTRCMKRGIKAQNPAQIIRNTVVSIRTLGNAAGSADGVKGMYAGISAYSDNCAIELNSIVSLSIYDGTTGGQFAYGVDVGATTLSYSNIAVRRNTIKIGPSTNARAVEMIRVTGSIVGLEVSSNTISVASGLTLSNTYGIRIEGDHASVYNSHNITDNDFTFLTYAMYLRGGITGNIGRNRMRDIQGVWGIAIDTSAYTLKPKYLVIAQNHGGNIAGYAVRVNDTATVGLTLVGNTSESGTFAPCFVAAGIRYVETASTGDDRPSLEFGSVIPTSGTYVQGDTRRVIFPSASAPVTEWVCTSGGTPGTWRPTKWIVGKNVTGSRPTLTASDIGVTYLDTTLDADGKPIWWNGTAWVDATGATV